MSRPPPGWKMNALGLGTLSSVHPEPPVHFSANGPTPTPSSIGVGPDPDAMQLVAERQDTPVRVCVLWPLAGLGVVSAVQVVPFHIAEAMLNSPCEPPPTARHTLAVGHATPLISLSPAGAGSMVQEWPFQDSASGVSTNCVFEVVYSPTARQFDGPEQETAWKLLRTAPVGTTGKVRVQELPFQIWARTCLFFAFPVPTAMQWRAAVQST